ncbi:MAG: TlpA family protein disulfide reductase [Cytophagales bacterium]|jgi:peroxiredoxin|nr:TlpA family protein disulfide reductase [Cytophagales bacterium]MCA6367787.1 TlpA family protein disulfide reductase [Cytophagales bacterium]MCA6369930.1 TlpA family protein disulfide reductase [Cytophagales bacterium]MCA6375088.1 TlpA family protein disulfide reductase [Cytophagales bacterium]MCA6382601.1 TlpA family protein disulfide reductase [Cytophagales bacterium]
MKTIKNLLLGITAVALAASCSSPENHELQEGKWRGEFALETHRVPFNFVVEDDTAALVRVSLLNADEKASLDSVYYKGDSVVIPINVYDAVLIGKAKGDSLKGYLRKNQSAKQGVPFSAARNQTYRFSVGDSTSTHTVNGKWSVNLISERDGKPSTRYTVGLLEQKGNRVTGTILTTTGDYRYLEGVLDGTNLKLSAFSGSNPSLIEASLIDSVHLKGEFISPGGKVILEATKSDTAHLPDPYALTFLKPGFERLTFSFPNLKGEPVSLTDERYKGKVVVLNVSGSWCPNCVDEASFLSPWYNENKSKGVEVLTLSFERKDDFNFAKERIGTFKKRFGIEYEVLFAGIADKKIVAEKLPQLNTFLSFPTTIFIDKNGRVRKVHTGYSGPATGKYYQEFLKEFNDTVDGLLSEPIGKQNGI